MITVSQTRLLLPAPSQHAQTPNWAPVTRAVPPKLIHTGQGKRELLGSEQKLPGVGVRLGAFGQIGTLCHLVNTSLPCEPAHIVHQHLENTAHT